MISLTTEGERSHNGNVSSSTAITAQLSAQTSSTHFLVFVGFPQTSLQSVLMLLLLCGHRATAALGNHQKSAGPLPITGYTLCAPKNTGTA